MWGKSSSPTGTAAETLQSAVGSRCQRAAELVAGADVLLLCTGAGFSADSGLAVYADVARVEAYAQRNLTYPQVCQPHWLQSEPDLFWGFWGQCFNDYRGTAPHSGFEIIDIWADQRFRNSEVAHVLRAKLSTESWSAKGVGSAYTVTERPGAFFAFTSNVDAHHFDWFRAEEIHECHGNTEIYQCSRTDCDPHVFRAPLDFAFQVDTETMLAPRDAPAPSLADVELLRKEEMPANDQEPCATVGRVRGGGRPHRLRYMPAPDESPSLLCTFENHPKCPRCGHDARPAILMFGDGDWLQDEAQTERFEQWMGAVSSLIQERHATDQQLRVVILEIGAGDNVPTVRRTSEDCLQRFLMQGADAYLVRVNKAQPLGDSAIFKTGGFQKERLVSVMAGGLFALTRMQEAMPEEMQKR